MGWSPRSVTARHKLRRSADAARGCPRGRLEAFRSRAHTERPETGGSSVLQAHHHHRPRRRRRGAGASRAGQAGRSAEAADRPGPALARRAARAAIQDLRSPDARDAADGRGTFSAPEVAVVKVTEPSPPSGGLDWGDAGIGAGGMLALTLLASGPRWRSPAAGSALRAVAGDRRLMPALTPTRAHVADVIRAVPNGPPTSGAHSSSSPRCDAPRRGRPLPDRRGSSRQETARCSDRVDASVSHVERQTPGLDDQRKRHLAGPVASAA